MEVFNNWEISISKPSYIMIVIWSQTEKKIARDLQARRRKNATIKKYFAEYQSGLRKSLTKKKYQGTCSFIPFVKTLLMFTIKLIKIQSFEFKK